MYGVLTARFADYAYGLAIGIAGKATSIVDERTNTLTGLHLIVHRTLYLARYIDDAVVGTYYYYVIVGQADIATELPVEDVVIDVDSANQAILAVYLDVTKRTDVAWTASHIQSVKDGSKGCECIGSRGLDLAHHIDSNGARLAHRETYLTATIAGS